MPNPAGKFLWGATICAHAVEGQDFHSDWWRWEQRPRRIVGDGTSEAAAGHLQRYRDDIQLVAKSGLNALQYGLSWARIEPESGTFDDEALAHYHDVFRQMHARGIAPIAVLQEHSLPGWFAATGAWESPDAPKVFQRYCARVYEALGDLCDYWIPMYEPLHWQRMVYGERRWPRPGQGRPRLVPGVRAIAACHREAWAFLTERDDKNRVGLSITAPALQPADPYSPWDQHVLRWQRQHLEVALPAAVSDGGGERAFSFLAVSVPGRQHVHMAATRPRCLLAGYELPPGSPSSADTAEPDAAGVGAALQRCSRWGVPVLVTGAGLATEDDGPRSSFLLDHIHEVLTNREQGLDVMGFCYRSLLDGFEWRHGFTRRYGLVHVDRKTLARTPNPSLFLYQDIARHDAIRPGTISRFCAGWQPPRQEAC